MKEIYGRLRREQRGTVLASGYGDAWLEDEMLGRVGSYVELDCGVGWERGGCRGVLGIDAFGTMGVLDEQIGFCPLVPPSAPEGAEVNLRVEVPRFHKSRDAWRVPLYEALVLPLGEKCEVSLYMDTLYEVLSSSTPRRPTLYLQHPRTERWRGLALPPLVSTDGARDVRRESFMLDRAYGSLIAEMLGAAYEGEIRVTSAFAVRPRTER